MSIRKHSDIYCSIDSESYEDPIHCKKYLEMLHKEFQLSNDSGYKNIQNVGSNIIRNQLYGLMLG